MRYTVEQLDRFALQDLAADACASERQADEGPYYPDRGITRESLLAYAAKCRRQIEKYATGGAHIAVVSGACAAEQ